MNTMFVLQIVVDPAVAFIRTGLMDLFYDFCKLFVFGVS